MAYGRSLRWVILTILVMTTFFLASFNATLRYIVDQRRIDRVAEAIKNKLDEVDDDKEEALGNNKDDGSSGKKKKKKKNDSVVRKDITLTGLHLPAGGEQQEEEIEELASELYNNRDQLLKKEQANPTFDKFHKTTRPIANMELPSVQSYNRQSYIHATPNNNNNAGAGGSGGSRGNNDSKTLSADAHYSKAIRMLSSNFDQLINGGNALPHPVYSGEYNQEIHAKGNGDGGRGDAFVKVDNSKLKRRRRRKKKKKKNKKRQLKNKGSQKKEESAGKKSTWHNKFILEQPHSYYELMKEYLDTVYEGMFDYVYEILGMDFDNNNNDDDDDDYNKEGGGGEASSSSSSSAGSNGGVVAGDATERSGEYHDDTTASTSHHHYQYEEDQFSWSDTRVGSQLIWMYGKLVSLWSRQHSGATLKKEVLSSSSSSSSSTASKEDDDNISSSSSTSSSSTLLSKQDMMAREGLFHLEKAAELGHPEAQRMVANSLASGILPLSDHSLMHRLAEWQYLNNNYEEEGEGDASTTKKNWTSILLQSTVQVPDDFSSGGQQLSRAILLWHLSAMDGNVESAMALGYRHLYSATGGSTLSSDLINDNLITAGYHPLNGGTMGGSSGSSSTSHYGVLGTCPTALAYYEAAANGVMDELESGPTKGKVNPPLDEHRLAEIYTHGGASVALDSNNKPDELEEALQYYRMLASRSRSPEPDLVAAFTIANFYYNGYRGVKQDLRLALKYYEICGDYNHWEGGGMAGLMHVWGIGMVPEERDLGKAYFYFSQGTPGGLDSCLERLKLKRTKNNKEDVVLCDRHGINGMGYLHLLGVDGLVDRDVNTARRWFELGKDFGDAESSYSYAMIRLGWMVTELEDLPTKVPTTSKKPPSSTRKRKNTFDQSYMNHRLAPADTTPLIEYSGPSASDYSIAIQQLQQAAAKGHLQAKHKLGMLYASGANIPKKHSSSKVVTQSCTNALRYFKMVADGGHTVSRRNRAAWKQYNAGDYESALRNYLASAETGSVIGQVNAAFLLEQGYCLGMTVKACTHASIRLWRAAARQGNLEACLRVGDFYYYGRMKKSRGDYLRKAVPPSKADDDDGETATLYDREAYLKSLEAKAFYFVPGPYRWSRYILYPEELLDVTWKWLSQSVRSLWRYASADSSGSSSDEVTTNTDEVLAQDTCSENDDKGTCAPEWDKNEEENAVDDDEEEFEHMAIAAQYYRKAAEEHKSSRANFNLAFMHEWGMGLTQDFPLAKRHYDLAGENNSNMAAVFALYAMKIHQKVVKLRMLLAEGESKDVVAEESVEGINLNKDRKNTLDKSPPPAANVAEELVEDNKGKDLKSSVDKSTPLATDNNKESPDEQLEAGQKYEIFTRMAKSFQMTNGAQKIFSGHVTGYDTNTHEYFILYEDGDQETMEEAMLDDLILFDDKGNIAKKKKKKNDRLVLDGIEWRLLEGTTDPRSGQKIVVKADDIVNDMIKSKKFEINYRYANLWQIDDGRGRFRAQVGPNIVNTEKVRAYLEVPVNSVNGGRICFNLCADVTMPWWDFRVALDSIENSYQFIHGTNAYADGCADVCFDIPEGEHIFELSLVWPEYYEKKYHIPTRMEIMNSGDEVVASGDVMADNFRFYPFVYDNFSSGDFSSTKWSLLGNGAPWRVILDEHPVVGHVAFAGPTADKPSGTSVLSLAVDLGYTGALITFQIKTKISRHHSGKTNNMVWFYIDDQRIRPWFGDDGKFHKFTYHIPEGLHTLNWSFKYTDGDPEDGVWLDEVRIHSHYKTERLRPDYNPKDVHLQDKNGKLKIYKD